MVADAPRFRTMRLRDGDLVLRPRRASDAEAITAARRDTEEIRSHPDNLPSRRVAGKAGFHDKREARWQYPGPRWRSN